MNKKEKTVAQALSAALILIATGVIALSLLVLSAPANAQGFFKKKAEPAQVPAAAPAPVVVPTPAPVPAPIKPTPMVAPPPPPPQPLPAAAPAFPPVPPAAPFPTKPLLPPAAPAKAQAPIPLAKPAQAVKPVRPARPAANASAPVDPKAGPGVHPGVQSNPGLNSGVSNAVRPIPARPVATQQSPSQACGNLNFIAKALCVSVNCVLPEFKGSAECVRLEQDRINNDRSRESYGGG